MRKDIIYPPAASRSAYMRPLVTAIVPVSLELMAATPTTTVPVSDGPGGEALSKESDFDLWQEKEAPLKRIEFNVWKEDEEL